jgi:hypothetical protein
MGKVRSFKKQTLPQKRRPDRVLHSKTSQYHHFCTFLAGRIQIWMIFAKIARLEIEKSLENRGPLTSPFNEILARVSECHIPAIKRKFLRMVDFKLHADLVTLVDLQQLRWDKNQKRRPSPRGKRFPSIKIRVR